MLRRPDARTLRGGFTVVEFTLAMLLTLMVLTASSLVMEKAMGALKDGSARDGATELAYQVLAKERTFGCGLGVGAGETSTAFPDSKVGSLCATLFGAASTTDPAARCPGDMEDTQSADYQPGGCFIATSRDPAHVQYRVYVRSIWRGAITPTGGVPATGCATLDADKAPIGQPSLLEREVVVRYQRNGRWSRPVVATSTTSTATDVSVVATGGNMVPSGVPYVPQTTAAVVGQLASKRSEPVDLTVTVPGQTAQHLQRWADDSGCVWFPFIPTNATLASAKLGISPGTTFTPSLTTKNLNIGKGF